MGAPPVNRFMRPLVAVLTAIRTFWIVLGISIVMLVLIELAYRGQSAARHAWRQRGAAAARSQHPYGALPWFTQYLRERNQSESRVLVWSSYVYWRREPFAGAYINVDSLGHRVTPQPGPSVTPARLVWFFGGSTMWGTFQRDSATIPAVASRRWTDRGRRDLEVINHGEYGYVFTQEVLALELALRRGGRPAVVVFLDGLNDVAATVINDSAGLPQNEARRVREFRLGRLMSPDVQGTAEEPRALGATAMLVLGRFSFVQRLLRAGAGRFQSRRTPEALGNETAATYAATVQWVEALAARYGFVPFYFWQPSPVTTGKPLSAFERSILATAPPEVAGSSRRETSLAAEAALDSAMRPVAGRRFVNLARAFDGDTSSVYLDFLGHTTEAGAARLAQAIADTVAVVWSPSGSSRAAPSARRSP